MHAGLDESHLAYFRSAGRRRQHTLQAQFKSNPPTLMTDAEFADHMQRVHACETRADYERALADLHEIEKLDREIGCSAGSGAIYLIGYVEGLMYDPELRVLPAPVSA